MSTSEEEMRNRLLAEKTEEEREKKKHQLQELELEEQNRKKTIIKPEQMNKDWPKIVEEFKKQYGKEPDKNGALVFDSPEEVTKFFLAQATATPPREFHGVQLGQDGKPIDNHVYSCGSGHLFQGSLKEIQTQIKKALENDPENQKLKNGQAYIENLINPQKTIEMRRNISDLRDSKEETLHESHKNSMSSTL
ncbi:hypothetical protein [Legionella cherrii]|uniref:Substrate of the Dot/Icm secretion system n=2 Tax=Legionella cherrii TaxID=28084 RepID=A0ABY6T3C5_9GAMM|nr:hypothetical protein [Legionella cherrii]VEB32720.1 Uncharacterised protein [Legionella cherrii]